MITIKVKLNYNGDVYISDENNMSDVKVKELKKKILDGEVGNLSFSFENGKYFFPPSVVEKSIITIYELKK